jgi:hypothetical protein
VAATVRPIGSYFSSRIVPLGAAPSMFNEEPSDKLAWLQLRELTDDPAVGLALFSGTRPQRNKLYRDFQNYVRQARTYWEAASRTDGSAAALPYYYAALNLAKAELLQSHPTQVVGKFIRHGLSMRASASPSIKGDRLLTEKGVFSLLYEKRVGAQLPNSTSLRVTNLLSLLPEIGHEVGQFGRARPYTFPVYHTVAADNESAWSMLLIQIYPQADPSEPTIKALLRHYDEVSVDQLRDWRQIFAFSTRMLGNGVQIFQSKRAHSISAADGTKTPDFSAATQEPARTFGAAIASALGQRSEFLLTHTLTKSHPFVLPLALASYASLFYLSSLVRYKPSALDPVRQGKQAWLMDSFATEIPVRILTEATDGITGRISFFEPQQFRS